MLTAILIALALVTPATELDPASFRCDERTTRQECTDYPDLRVWPCSVWCAYHEDVCPHHRDCGRDPDHAKAWFGHCSGILQTITTDRCVQLACSLKTAHVRRDKELCLKAFAAD